MSTIRGLDKLVPKILVATSSGMLAWRELEYDEMEADTGAYRLVIWDARALF